VQDRSERERVESTYRRYGASRRKQRAWHAENPGNRAIRAELVASAFAAAGPALTGAREILDVGCGTGWWLELLAARPDVPAPLHGLELLPERARAAAARVPTASISTGDARMLPYEDRRFSVVSLLTVLSSLAAVRDVDVVLSEVRRVLAPAGVVIVWEPRARNPLNRDTLLIAPEMIGRAFPGASISSRSITLAPPLARRLGRSTVRLYARLSTIPVLRTHRFTVVRCGAITA
jgi:SAM-dependent methyltransferase